MTDKALTQTELIERLRTKDALLLIAIMYKPDVEIHRLVERLPIRRWRARRAINRLLELDLIELTENGETSERYSATELGTNVGRDWLMSLEVATFEPWIVSDERRAELKAPFPTDHHPWL